MPVQRHELKTPLGNSLLINVENGIRIDIAGTAAAHYHVIFRNRASGAIEFQSDIQTGWWSALPLAERSGLYWAGRYRARSIFPAFGKPAQDRPTRASTIAHWRLRDAGAHPPEHTDYP